LLETRPHWIRIHYFLPYFQPSYPVYSYFLFLILICHHKKLWIIRDCLFFGFRENCTTPVTDACRTMLFRSSFTKSDIEIITRRKAPHHSITPRHTRTDRETELHWILAKRRWKRFSIIISATTALHHGDDTVNNTMKNDFSRTWVHIPVALDFPLSWQ